MPERKMILDSKTERFYNGQLTFYKKIDGNIITSNFSDRFFSNLLQNPYKHQVKCAKNNENNIILSGPDGCGKTTISLIVAAYKYLVHSKTTVIICDNETQVRHYEQILNNYLKEYNLEWLLKANKYEEHLDNVNKPGLYILSADKINELNENEEQRMPLKDTLSFVVIDDLSNFNEVNLLIINNFFNIMKKYRDTNEIDHKLSCIMNSDYYKNLRNVAENITGLKEWTMIQDDHQYSTPKEFRMWATQPVKYEYNQKRITRKHYFDELADFTNLALDNNSKMAIIINEGIFSSTDKEHYENEWGKNIIVGRNTDDIVYTNGRLDDIKYWIYLGIREKSDNFIQSIRYIGKREDNNQVYLIYMHTPKYRKYIKHPEKLFKDNKIDALPEFAYNTPVAYDNNTIWTIIERIYSENEYIEKDLSKTTEFKAQILFLPDNMVIINNRRFVVIERNIQNRTIFVRKEDTFCLSIPVIEDIKMQKRDEKSAKEFDLNSLIKIKQSEANISYNIKGYKRYPELDTENEKTVNLKNPISCQIQAPCLMISPIQKKIDINAFANVLWSSIESAMNTENLYYLVYENELIIYTDKSFKNLLDSIVQPEFLTSLLKSSFDIIDACPSKEPTFCDVCTIYNDEKPESKESLYKMLAGFADVDNAEQRSELKFTENRQLDLNKPELNILYERVYKETVDLINQRLDIPTEFYIPLLMGQEKNKKFFGQYFGDQKKLYINSTLNEVNLTATIAHEYTHKWQGESGEFDASWSYHDESEYNQDAYEIPFKGSLFSEGMATWVELDIISHFGITEWLSKGEEEVKSDIRPLMYPAGYIAFELLVRNYGYIRTKSMVAKGISEDIYNESIEEGLKTFLKGQYNHRHDNKKEFQCFKHPFNRQHDIDDNLVKISYVIQGEMEKNKKITFTKMLSDIKVNYQKNYEEINEYLYELMFERIFKDREFNSIPPPCASCKSAEFNSLQDICWISDKNISVADNIIEDILKMIDQKYHDGKCEENRLRLKWNVPCKK